MSAPARDPHNHLPIGSLEGLEQFAPDRSADGRRDPRGGLDSGIRHFVLILRSQGIETCQSCQGGPGHSFLEPTIEFYGGAGEGLRAVAAALTYGLPAAELRREWSVRNGELHGPIWTMTFSLRADLWLRREAERSKAYFKRKATGRDAC
jgi:hypothetical protein